MIQQRRIISALPYVLTGIALDGFGMKQQGKVRDYYVLPDKRIIVTTDRQSAFDVILGQIPFKGAVLNLLAAYWFNKTKHIIPNHMVGVPHPNVLVAHNCEPIPVEMVVRGYISGVTKTSIWHSYKQGERFIYGLKFPDGLTKNQQLPAPVITPTTHGGGAGGHDERLTREEILTRKLVDPNIYKQMEEASLALFQYGSTHCRKRGLILVDTKYEFGLYNGKLLLMDEIHTPDSSRFWKADTYKARVLQGKEPDNFDKEFLRLWYAEQGYRGDGPPPPMPRELIVALAERYIAVYEQITGLRFTGLPYPLQQGINDAVKRYLPAVSKAKTGLAYKDVGDDYDIKDPFKTFAHKQAGLTHNNFKDVGFKEVAASRGESAYVFDMGNMYGACTQEGLGTKNLIADAVYDKTHKRSYYDNVAIDTVATIVNDMVTVGARPLVVSPHWSVEDNGWFSDTKRYQDLIRGWVDGCTMAGAVYGGGETPTLKGILRPGSVDLSGSCFGIINPKTRLLLGEKLKVGDHIVLIASSGIHTNGLSLARKIATERLPKGYFTQLSDKRTLGEALLSPSFIYARLVQQLFKKRVDIHYLVHITGHGWRKLMRANRTFTYRLHTVPPVPAEFSLLAEAGPVSLEEQYGTFNMGAGYAIFVPKSGVPMVRAIAKRLGMSSWDAGTVEEGVRRVIIEPLDITFSGSSFVIR